MSGAVAMATNGALRGGAGLVSFATLRAVQLTVAGLTPCATSIPLGNDSSGQWTSSAVQEAIEAMETPDVLAIGPGLGVGAHQQNLVQAALEQTLPLVLDADGLNNLVQISDWPKRRRCPMILTPHPGEFSRLTGRSIADIQADREGAMAAAMEQWVDGQELPALVCALKGAGTLVCNGRRIFVNGTGNPGMATGGSGDVLTGVAAAMLAQGFEPFDAACLAVHLHGRAGDLAARKLGQVSLIATDLLEYLPLATKEAVG
jgi:NAD(P)H-hydrate epimerase